MDRYTIPQSIYDYIDKRGYQIYTDATRAKVEEWDAVFRAQGDFWDYSESDGKRRYQVHRRTVHPAYRVANEWASLMLNDQTKFTADNEQSTEWLDNFTRSIGFRAHGQGLVTRAFALGTGAWGLWLDPANSKMQIRRYNARQVLPLSWDDDGVSEAALCSRYTDKGKQYDQVQLHLADGIIETAIFDEDGEQVRPDGVEPVFETGCPHQTFSIVKPSIANTISDNSPYGVSVYAGATDALQAVDLCYDALMNEVDNGKLRIFISDMLIEGTGNSAVPFGKDDITVYRKVESTGDAITAFAPSLRTDGIMRAYRTALQTMGDLCGFGLSYFDVDKSGGIRTATEVASDNAALMRNVRKHEHALGDSISQVLTAAVWCASNVLELNAGETEAVRVDFDDSIITDTQSEKAHDLQEVNVTMNAWEYRAKWYGEDEETAKANVPKYGVEPLG